MIASYPAMIGLCALIVPPTLRKRVNTFGFAIQPLMIITLVAAM
ncbi:MAG: hypothetical protein K0S58_1306 [Nitrospira sp.]|jgi:hypothetical protein|nr:hypothetical protein [Nitrospira sp.]